MLFELRPVTLCPRGFRSLDRLLAFAGCSVQRALLLVDSGKATFEQGGGWRLGCGFVWAKAEGETSAGRHEETAGKETGEKNDDVECVRELSSRPPGSLSWAGIEAKSGGCRIRYSWMRVNTSQGAQRAKSFI